MSNTTNRCKQDSIFTQFALPTAMTGKVSFAPGVALLSLILLTGCKLTRAGYESAGYNVVRESSAFESRATDLGASRAGVSHQRSAGGLA